MNKKNTKFQDMQMMFFYKLSIMDLVKFTAQQITKTCHTFCMSSHRLELTLSKFNSKKMFFLDGVANAFLLFLAAFSTFAPRNE